MNRVKSGLRSAVCIGVVSAVLLCHVAGALCLMTPSVAMGEPALLVPAVSHGAMAGGHDCTQYVPSVSDRLDTAKSVRSIGPVLAAPAVPVATRGMADPSCGPRAGGTSLFLHLSTFRI